MTPELTDLAGRARLPGAILQVSRENLGLSVTGDARRAAGSPGTPVAEIPVFAGTPVRCRGHYRARMPLSSLTPKVEGLVADSLS
jgi:hypothetical protein